MFSQLGRRAVSNQFNFIPRRSLSTVYTWGTGDQGQLGQPEIRKSGVSQKYIEPIPTPVEALANEDVVHVSCGATHTAVATGDGRVLTFGAQSSGALGHSVGGKTGVCLVPTKVEGLEGHKIIQVSCGEKHTAALSDEGRVFTWGVGGDAMGGVGALGRADSESRVRAEQVLFAGGDDVKITSITSGRMHMLALGEEGEVWSWGKGSYGRLGNLSSVDQLEPYPVELILDLDLNITKITCGKSFSLALADTGMLYGWGRNDHAQLAGGHGLSMDMYAMENYPVPIPDLEAEHIIDMGAGDTHSVAVNKDGEVFLWGQKTWMSPHKLSVLNSKRIVSVSAGGGVSTAICDAGEVYSWGKGMTAYMAGTLGHGDSSSHVQPEKIKTLLEPIKQVSCGTNHVAAVTGLPDLPK